MPKFAIKIAATLTIGAALGFGAAQVTSKPAPLPTGFTIQHADHITYVCSERPVYCTGNK
jgi:hypothetical protein